MTVGNVKSCSYASVKTTKFILSLQHFGAHIRSEFYAQHINCITYKKGDSEHWRDVGPIEGLKNRMMVGMKLVNNVFDNLLTILFFCNKIPVYIKVSAVKMNIVEPFVERFDRLGELLPPSGFLKYTLIRIVTVCRSRWSSH